ncbi:NADH dehydrogenase I chain C/D [Buchnera aphidicola str. Bp (Baizongia pistaciae)]|uniref:NADH-quinone oxidoreductase subunit C/D n=1 Tax=Buchnera aphidicola subsp. Baizongia pistaciae (strain Bp) TaxID=224915 RepID=NUOCD_BUCBP|nr:NADH-quinone oxidoreductase subunit C/D [Buchnera aphidicola]Q89AU4.1 RecName: Full=NADH-quinone oxidoreductase subunit C/D; AltName: Full=NADH dehydrogenase I subunit C/D; AltName: Full=NDH-1 subunit C/D [Buchnera aphidicola str. Bp (Baizongia pistaciae)]AAO26879.1 NADH dehydrogenase I chain C/D [Buchnera aphidicola str. Bp (Baizongia pistaciae)]
MKKEIKRDDVNVIEKDFGNNNSIILKLFKKFGEDSFFIQTTVTDIIVLWIDGSLLLALAKFLLTINNPYNMLFDLYGIDERMRLYKHNLPLSHFSVVYHFISINRNSDIILKIALLEEKLSLPTLTKLYPNANWYEREIWDMFGISFENHPNLIRILMPKTWVGHPLRKDHPARATEFDPYVLNKYKEDIEMEALKFKPEEWGMKKNKQSKYMFLNLGPNHPSAHGAFRIILQLDGEEIVDCVPDIGYHHRGAEKMGERQTWHNYIPYTDRVEYLGGCINEMPYVLAVERLAGIEVSQRIEVIRIMLSELFRINSHLLFISTFIQDVGAMTPVFLAFTDRQKIYDLIELITGSRMHPAWFRIGGLAHDLPKGWNALLKEFLLWMPKRLLKYINVALKNSILISRSKGIAEYNKHDALLWGVTGAGLRATGINFDVRKKRPYSGYQNFDFEVPIGAGISDCYSRVMLKLEEIWQSLAILKQCLENMPEGPFKMDHPNTTPPHKVRTLQHIETMISHFLKVSWGPVLSSNESFKMVEATKGINSYYLISDGNTMSYRTRIRTPSFPHLQQIPSVIRGNLISDLIAYLGSIDFVMSDVDR